MKTFAATAIALALILVPSLHARRRPITPPSNKLPRDKPLADVFTPAVPDPAPALGNCAATIKSCSAAKYCFPSNSACVQAGFIDGQAWRVCIYATEYGLSGTPMRISGPSKGLAVGPVDFRPSLSNRGSESSTRPEPRRSSPDTTIWCRITARRASMWVTQWHATENTSWADVPQTPEKYLYNFSNGTQGPESVREHDLVLWYLATAHHDPIDEDRQPDGAYAVTLAHFFGFELNPHNLFPQNPLGGKICD